MVLTNGLPSVNFVFDFEVWDPLPDCVEEFVWSEAHGVDVVGPSLQRRSRSGHHAKMGQGPTNVIRKIRRLSFFVGKIG